MTPPRSVVDALVSNHRAFLSFLEKRLGDRVLAEDILQQAFVRGVDKAATVQNEEAVVAWFYRILRNSVTDHFRRSASSSRKLELLARELETPERPEPGLHAAVCQCVNTLAATLKQEYSEALRRIELDGISLKEYASELGISENNAAVRVFRAREALRKRVTEACGTCAEHGCFDCSCESASTGCH